MNYDICYNGRWNPGWEKDDVVKDGDRDVCVEAARISLLSTSAGSSFEQTIKNSVKELGFEG